jgi:hypothetical protein
VRGASAELRSGRRNASVEQRNITNPPQSQLPKESTGMT